MEIAPFVDVFWGRRRPAHEEFDPLPARARRSPRTGIVGARSRFIIRRSRRRRSRGRSVIVSVRPRAARFLLLEQFKRAVAIHT